MMEHKFFNRRKYLLHQERWVRNTFPQTRLSWDMWNFNNPSDTIKEGDGNVIHHKNGDSIDDRIENLQKMTRNIHTSLHHKGKEGLIGISNPMYGTHRTGSDNPNWKGGLKHKELYLGSETIKGLRYQIIQIINSLGEILGSRFTFSVKRGGKNEKIGYNRN